ncbi:hypothetical protein MLD38_012174 [Melastoma candidum]|uniref:Uncharacterized protein n=1 Tax=Melastoma candidum TaxID=119954 RepID=A0ACB9R5H1_9MYRT|nr:hypothetical protein MLD38_012174 [Melastoma candidum]
MNPDPTSKDGISAMDKASRRLSDLARQLRLHRDDQGSGIGGKNRASVLICIFEGDSGDLRVILTKRASTLSSHSGEVALPGGKRDDADKDDVETALREAREEIGLDPSLVEVVAVLEPFGAKRGIVVIPVVAMLFSKDDFIPVLNPDEVEDIFDAPLEMFLKDENRRDEEREWLGEKYLLHYFDYETDDKKFVIWALTAGILIEAATVIFQRQPSFDERRPKFWRYHADIVA